MDDVFVLDCFGGVFIGFLVNRLVCFWIILSLFFRVWFFLCIFFVFWFNICRWCCKICRWWFLCFGIYNWGSDVVWCSFFILGNFGCFGSWGVDMMCCKILVEVLVYNVFLFKFFFKIFFIFLGVLCLMFKWLWFVYKYGVIFEFIGVVYWYIFFVKSCWYFVNGWFVRFDVWILVFFEFVWCWLWLVFFFFYIF